MDRITYTHELGGSAATAVSTYREALTKADHAKAAIVRDIPTELSSAKLNPPAGSEVSVILTRSGVTVGHVHVSGGKAAKHEINYRNVIDVFVAAHPEYAAEIRELEALNTISSIEIPATKFGVTVRRK